MESPKSDQISVTFDTLTLGTKIDSSVHCAVYTLT